VKQNITWHWELERMTNGQVVAKLVVLFQHLSGRTEPKYEKHVTVGNL